MFLWKVIKSAVINTSIEPAILLYFITHTMTMGNLQSLLLQKICHPGDYPPTVFSKCDLEMESQKLVTNIQTWKDFLLHLVSVVFVIFAGPWSDRNGRKPLMWLPLIGQILSDLLCMLNVYFWSWPPELAALAGSLLPAITGGMICFATGTKCYISDVTSVKSRTYRTGICVGMIFLGQPIGSFIFGSVFQYFTYQGVFLICIVLNMISLIYLLIFIKEDKSSNPECSTLWKGIFNTKPIKDSFKTTFSPRSGNKRCVVLMMLIGIPIVPAPFEGEAAVLYYFFHYKFKWNEVDFGYYAGYRAVVICFGTLVSMMLLSRLLRISDAAIGMLASLTLMLSSAGFSFATQTWELIVYPIVDFLQGAGLTVVYTIVSKTVDPTELGQVYSVITIARELFSLISVPLYAQVYHHTFTRLAGAFFLLSFTYGAVTLVMFGIVYVLLKKQDQMEIQIEK